MYHPNYKSRICMNCIFFEDCGVCEKGIQAACEMFKYSEFDISLIDKAIEKVWEDLTDIPFDENEDSELILAEDYHIWKVGTDRDEIWHWFDETHSKGVAWLLNERE